MASSSKSKLSSQPLREHRKELENLLQDLALMANMVDQTQEYLKERDDIRAKLAAKERETHDLRHTQEELFGLFEDRYATYKGTVESMNQAFVTKTAEKDRAYGKMLANLGDRAEIAENELRQTKRELEEKTVQETGLHGELRKAKADLGSIRREIGWRPIGPSFSKDLERLSRSLQQFCEDRFAKDLPIDVKEDEIFRELQKSGFFDIGSAAIPISNSQASRLLRAVWAEATIAKKICEAVFRDPVLFVSHRETYSDSILECLYKESPRQESILRPLLYKSSQLMNPGWQEGISRQLTKSLTPIFDPLLPASGEQQSFEFGLRTIVADAFTAWDTAQKSCTRMHVLSVCVDSERIGGRDDGGWETRGEFDAESFTISDGTPNTFWDPVVTIFPRIYTEHRTAAPPIHPGTVLWSDQRCYLAAKAEVHGQLSRVRCKSMSSRKGRTGSITV